MNKFSLLVIGFLSSSLAFSQIGGDNTYEFLNLNTSARIAALGGNQIAVRDNDPFLAFDNPSLLNSEMHNKVAMTYQSYLADVGVGFASYTRDYDSLGTFNAGIKYISYGTFTETDNGGNEIGEFNAGEYAFVLGYARALDSSFSVGVNVKSIYSSFYDYQSVGLAADLGLTYYSAAKGLTIALLSKNMGAQLTQYNEESESLPFELQLGMTKRFAKVPLRFGIIAHQLQQWDLTYENPNDEEQTTLLSDPEEGENENEFFRNLANHLIINAEFLITDNFNVRLGYNFLRREELKIDEELGTVGLSWGFGMRINRFHFSYGRSAFHQAGATNTFSISTRLSDFMQ